MQDLNSANRRVLIVDDNDAIHADFRKAMGSDVSSSNLAAMEAELFGEAQPAAGATFEIDSAHQGREALEKVAAALSAGKPYAMAFVDMRMPPGWDGVKTIQHLWEKDPALQIVICTAYSDHSWEEIISQLGITDRLLILKKPFDAVEVMQLATALTEKWSLKRDATLKLEQLQDMVEQRTSELRHLATHDKLTGLPNRGWMQERLAACVANNRQHPGFHYALLFLDFDSFKIINDSLGHEMGDLLLIAIGQRLRKLADDICNEKGLTCSAARLGGDEFVLLLEGFAQASDATRIAEKCLHSLGEHYQLNAQTIHSTASIGITTSDFGYTAAEAVLRDADAAMYRAKAAGKAQYLMFNPQMHQEAMQRLMIENDLRRAIELGQLELYYQPVVALHDSSLIGFEALLRWNHPQRGLMPPMSFISIAEETGLIHSVGMWVMRQALRQLRAWQNQYPHANRLFVSVNISRRQFFLPSLAEDLARVVREGGVAPSALALEVTERVATKDIKASETIMKKLSALGVQLHMDDFGTGYSALSALHKLPLNVLKIDRSFVTEVGERRDYAAVVNAIVNLAHNLKIRLIAEGIETAEQVSMLQALDCDYAQGFFFSHPAPAAEAEALLRKQALPRAA